MRVQNNSNTKCDSRCFHVDHKYHICHSCNPGECSYITGYPQDIIYCPIVSPSKVLHGNLAFTDLGVGLMAQPLYAVRSLSSDVFVKCVTGLLFDLLSGHLSITSFLSMMFISLDRFMALHLKLRYRKVVTLKRPLLVVVLVRLTALPWALSLVWNSKVYFLLILSIMPVCLVISSLSFTKIYLVLRRQKRNLQNPMQQESVRRANALKLSRYRQSVNSMLLVFCALLAAYIPEWMVVLVRSIHGRTELLNKATKLTLTIILVNSTVNPILYLWRMKELRASALEVLADVFPRSVARRNASNNAIESVEMRTVWQKTAQ